MNRLEERFKPTWREHLTREYQPRGFIHSGVKPKKPVLSPQDELRKLIPDDQWYRMAEGFFKKNELVYDFFWCTLVGSSFYINKKTADYTKYNNLITIVNNEVYKVIHPPVSTFLILNPIDVYEIGK